MYVEGQADEDDKYKCVSVYQYTDQRPVLQRQIKLEQVFIQNEAGQQGEKHALYVPTYYLIIGMQALEHPAEPDEVYCEKQTVYEEQ